MTDYGTQYGTCRERITALVDGLSTDEARTPVGACPDWTVHDVVAHLSGAVADVLAGRLEGAGSPAWTAAQVDARRDTPVAQMIDEWNAAAPQFEDGLRTIGPPMAAIAVADAWHHEQDLRGALGRAGGADPALEHTAIDAMAPLVGGAISAQGLAPLRVVAGSVTVQTADGTPGATVTGAPYELARALMGRRTAEEIRALTWEGDAEPYVAALAATGPPSPIGC
jgi:uncharacterized protein (TIGR03083 family)